MDQDTMLAWLNDGDPSNVVPATQALVNELYSLINELIPHCLDPDEPLPPLTDKKGCKDELDRLTQAIVSGALASTGGGSCDHRLGHGQRNSGFIGAMPLSMSRRSLQVS